LASNLGTLSKCTIILLRAVNDCPGGRTAAVAHHMSFAQLLVFLFIKTLLAAV